jgi:hypothetical protein
MARTTIKAVGRLSRQHRDTILRSLDLTLGR